MSPRKPERDTDSAVLTREKTATPRQYRVLLFNDDYTTMEFVLFVLEEVFRKSPAEAMEIMLKVHHSGSATAGVYTREVAETKVRKVHDLAQQDGYPLRAGMEEA